MGIYIIAEAGVNHNGSIDLACKLVDEAKKAGVDCIKFQTFKAEKLVSHSAKKAEYQKRTTGDSSQQDMLKQLELSFEEFTYLKDYCDKAGIAFLSTPFDFDSLAFLDRLLSQFSMFACHWQAAIGFLRYAQDDKTGEILIALQTGICQLEYTNQYFFGAVSCISRQPLGFCG